MTPVLLDRLMAMTDAVGAWLLAISVQLAILGAVVVMVDRVLAGRAWPQLRAALWWLLIVAPLASPFLKSPLSVWSLVDPAAPVNGYLSRIIGPDPVPHEPWQFFYRGAAPLAPMWSAGRLAVAAWLTGCVLLALAFAWRLRAVRREAPPAPASPMPDWFSCAVREAAGRLGVRRVPTVRIGAGPYGPAVTGVLRPVVVMPARMIVEATREQVAHALLHEFAHIRRRDAWASRLCQCVQIALWFHPAVWLARRQLETLREICCDEMAARAVRDGAPAYRRTLLHLAGSMLARPAPLGFVHHHSQVMARLMHLHRPQARRPRVVRATATALFATLLICCVPRSLPTSRPVESAAVNLCDLPGCLQLRYAVMHAMAMERQGTTQ